MVLENLEHYLARSMSWAEYVKLIDDLLMDGKATGPDQSESLFNYSKLNRQRMHRLEKTVAIDSELELRLKGLRRKMKWLILTEGWCGDAAQNLPVIEKIASLSGEIETRYILRDENLELMDQYLSNAGRGIPKLIAVDADTSVVLGTWGARPAAAQGLYYNLKASGTEKPAIMEQLQRWYNADRTESLQAEFLELIKIWDAEPVSASAVCG